MQVRYLIAPGTIDDAMWPLLGRKLQVVGKALDGNATGSATGTATDPALGYDTASATGIAAACATGCATSSATGTAAAAATDTVTGLSTASAIEVLYHNCASVLLAKSSNQSHVTSYLML